MRPVPASASSVIDPWYLENLVCPVDTSPLRQEGSFLVSEDGRRYPIVEGVPVMLRGDVDATIGVAHTSLDLAVAIASGLTQGDPPLYADTLGVTDEERDAARRLHANQSKYDPVVATMVGATSGFAYKHLMGVSSPYPIPGFRFPTDLPGTLLDVGCNWGRWTIAAAREGHLAVGIDPQLGAVVAAIRVARELGVAARFVVGDARYLPFPEKSFDYVWSYGVMQHLSDPDAETSLRQMKRVLRKGGVARVQMANALAVRSFYHQARRNFRAPMGFEVRYRSPSELRSVFMQIFGNNRLTADCFFGLGLQWSDFDHMNLVGKSVLIASEGLRRLSDHVGPLRWFADSVFCTARVPPPQ